MTDTVLVLRGARKRFGGAEVLRGVDLLVHRGETVALIGPSGSGKSTLLRCAALLEVPDGGSLQIGNLCAATEKNKRTVLSSPALLRQARMSCGMVFQSFQLFPHRTVLQNLTEPQMLVLKSTRREAEARARVLLSEMGLSEKADARPAQLSGGQRQRAAIARALTLNPQVLLLDEPTSALDPELTAQVLETLLRLKKKQVTMVIATHEMAFARRAADKILFLEDGVTVEEGPPEQLFESPLQARTAQFLHGMA